MNLGDAQTLALDITVDDEPAVEGQFEEIEVTFNPELHGHSVRKLLSTGAVYWDVSAQKYCLNLYQEDTFQLHPGVNTWQLRVMCNGTVISTPVTKINIGPVNSKHVLEDVVDG